MSSAPAFASTPKVWANSVSTANTARDGTGTIATIGTAGASGSKVERIVIVAVANPADSTVTVFLHDGSTYWYFDEFDIGDPAAASATVAGYREERAYSDLTLPSGWSLRAAITVTLTAGVVNVFALAADL